MAMDDTFIIPTKRRVSFDHQIQVHTFENEDERDNDDETRSSTRQHHSLHYQLPTFDARREKKRILRHDRWMATRTPERKKRDRQHNNKDKRRNRSFPFSPPRIAQRRGSIENSSCYCDKIDESHDVHPEEGSTSASGMMLSSLRRSQSCGDIQQELCSTSLMPPKWVRSESLSTLEVGTSSKEIAPPCLPKRQSSFEVVAAEMSPGGRRRRLPSVSPLSSPPLSKMEGSARAA